MKIQIEFDDVLSEVLTEEEMKEFILALVKYKQSKGIDDFSSRAIKVAYMLTTQKTQEDLLSDLEKKQRISEINRQNVNKRWEKYRLEQAKESGTTDPLQSKGLEEKQKEERIKARSEIYRQNALKRWDKHRKEKEQSGILGNINISLEYLKESNKD